MYLKCVPFTQDHDRTAITFSTMVEISPGSNWYGRTTIEVPRRLVEFPQGSGCAKIQVKIVDQNEAHALVEITDSGIARLFKVPQVALIGH